VCPYLENADSRCAVHQSLHRLDDALTLCAEDFENCPVYREMLEGNAPVHSQTAERVYAAG
jgi:hypothetical protein